LINPDHGISMSQCWDASSVKLYGWIASETTSTWRKMQIILQIMDADSGSASLCWQSIALFLTF